MNEKIIQRTLCKFEDYLRYKVENHELTIKKYLSETKRFLNWLYDCNNLNIKDITKITILKYKEYLCKHYENASTINGNLGINHIFLSFIGKGDLIVKKLKVVKKNCKSNGRYIKEKDYQKLIKCTKLNYLKAVLVAKIIANTGIRVSEVSQITYEMVTTGKIIVNNKAKIREIILNSHVRRDILKYCKKNKINKGVILLNHKNKVYTSNGIWRMLKRLAVEMEVDTKIVFPHSFRHLFSIKHYSIHKDIEALATILGHSNTETTMIYLKKTVDEYATTMNIWYRGIKKATEL